MNELEMLMAEAYDEGVVAEVIRPAAVLHESAARLILLELAGREVRAGGVWYVENSLWRRYARPWQAGETGADATTHALAGTIQVAFGTPSPQEMTVYRATVTRRGADLGLTAEGLCDEALAFGGLTLAGCRRHTFGV